MTTRMVTFWILQIELGIKAVRWSTRDSHQKKRGKRIKPMTRHTMGCARALRGQGYLAGC